MAKAERRRSHLTVMVVDDHPMWRQTLRQVIEGAAVGRVVAEAADGRAAVALAVEHSPDVVVMDLDLPVLDGGSATRLLLAELPTARVLVLSASDERADVLTAIRAGATGYLLKTSEPADVADAIRRVHSGELVLPSRVADVVMSALRDGDAPTCEGNRLAVVLADASGLFREGLRRILIEAGFDVCGTTGRGEEVERLATNESAQVVVVDAGLLVDVDLVARIRVRNPNVGLLVLARDVDPAGAAALLHDGTGRVGYLLKDRVSDVGQLADAVRRVANGGVVVDPEVAQALLQARRRRDALDELTQREREVLELMAEGRSNQAICDRLYLSPKAVEGHVRNLFTKLNLPPAADDHRRVLAVLTYLRAR